MVVVFSLPATQVGVQVFQCSVPRACALALDQLDQVILLTQRLASAQVRTISRGFWVKVEQL